MLEMSDALGRLLSEYEFEEWCKAWRNFWRLYFGKIGPMESDELGKILGKLEKQTWPEAVSGWPQSNEDLRIIFNSKHKYEQLAYDFAYEVRATIQKDWDVQLSSNKRKGKKGPEND